ncbi:isochorismatase family cysteine hydrolase [Pseudogracilibacillus sp. SE30717A]|uniref:cysteine hydrolase family protein n=1 Tax=Pseudogracilibacillus sp. SE30717A TaxID=3098293 RepID=UPI00300DFEAC
MKVEETALVLIDLQKESNFGLQNLDDVLAKTKDVIKACREVDIPIIYTRQINRHDQIGLSKGEPLCEDGTPFYYSTSKENHEIIDEVAPDENDIVIDKYRWSAFHETSLDLILRSIGVKHIIIGGVVSDGCVMTTVFDAYFRDYQVHLVKDMCTTSNEGAHMSSLMIMANWVYNLEVYNAEHLINRLHGKKYSHWKFQKADALQFTPENMRNIFENLHPKEDL